MNDNDTFTSVVNYRKIASLLLKSGEHKLDRQTALKVANEARDVSLAEWIIEQGGQEDLFETLLEFYVDELKLAS